MKKIAIRIAPVVALGLTIVICLHSQKSAVDKARRLHITCVNNLKQIELVFRVWSGDHNGQYPWNLSTNAGGTRELCALDRDGFDANSFRHFQVMSNEMSTPLLLVCPSDSHTKSAAGFASLATSNVSYRIHIVPGFADGATNKIPLVVCPTDGSILYYDGSVKAGNPQAGD